MRRAALAAVLVVVLGAGCTEDRPATTASPSGDSAASVPQCEAQLGAVEGFELSDTEEVPQPDSVGVREEYRDSEGRTLNYLLGIFGEIGEGLPFLGEMDLATGATARFLGQDLTWVLVWDDTFPCEQVAVIGNGFQRTDFLETMREAEVLPSADPSADSNDEWVSVFDVAEDPADLDPGTDELMEAVGGAIAISPASCWTGLAERLDADPDNYVAAVVASDRSELEDVTVEVGRQPLVTGEFPALCVD